MSESSSFAIEKSIGLIPHFGKKAAHFVPVREALVRCILDLVPSHKPWACLLDLLGLKEKAVRNRLSRRSRFTDDEIAILLRTENGICVLSALMGSARPRWYERMLKHAAIDDARRHEEAAHNLLTEAIDALATNDEAIARARNAMAVHRADTDSAARTVARKGAHRFSRAMANRRNK